MGFHIPVASLGKRLSSAGRLSARLKEGEAVLAEVEGMSGDSIHPVVYLNVRFSSHHE